MDIFFIKAFPGHSNLTFSPAPIIRSDLEKLGNLDLHCIFNVADELKLIEGIEAKIANMVLLGRIKDYDVPVDMDYFICQIGYICDLLKEGKNVHVHCMGGRGRTGMVLACIKIMLDKVDAETALKITKKTCGGPETINQIEFVKKFANHAGKLI